jgi:hypothetical protein
VPRMDNSGELTCDLVEYLRGADGVRDEVLPLSPARTEAPAQGIARASGFLGMVQSCTGFG